MCWLKCNPLQCLIYLAINKMNADIFGLNVKTKCPKEIKTALTLNVAIHYWVYSTGFERIFLILCGVQLSLFITLPLTEGPVVLIFQLLHEKWLKSVWSQQIYVCSCNKKCIYMQLSSSHLYAWVYQLNITRYVAIHLFVLSASADSADCWLETWTPASTQTS